MSNNNYKIKGKSICTTYPDSTAETCLPYYQGLEYAKPCPEDGWLEYNHYDTFKINGEPAIPAVVRPGSKPAFNKLAWRCAGLNILNPTNEYRIRRDNNYLYLDECIIFVGWINLQQWDRNYFSDNVIPTRVIVEICGGGAGGAGGDWVNGSGGGGGGAYWCGILNIKDYKPVIKVGRSGLGGGGNSDGGAGMPTQITIGEYTIVCGGGFGGHANGSSAEKKGAGGTFQSLYTIDGVYWGLNYTDGKSGGGEGGPGSSCEGVDIYNTNNIDDRQGVNKLIKEKQSGGWANTSSPGLNGGGGGASRLGNGGRGGDGQWNSNPRDGGYAAGYGAGGGGGAQGFFSNTGGGGGSPGYFALYY